MAKKKKKLSAWNKKVKQVAKDNPDLSFKKVIKLAKKEYGKKSTKKKRNPNTKVKRKVRKTARKKKKTRRRGFLNLRQMFSLIKVGSFIAPAAYSYSQMTGSTGDKLARTFIRYSGIDANGNFNMNILKGMWGPLLATTLITTGISKVSSIIRRL